MVKKEFLLLLLALQDVSYALRSPKVGPVHFSDSELSSHLSQNSTCFPTLVMFHSPNCGHCTKFKPVFQETALQNKQLAFFVFVDASLHQKFVSKLQIAGVPTLVSFKNEKEFRKLNTRDPKVLIRMLKEDFEAKFVPVGEGNGFSWTVFFQTNSAKTIPFPLKRASCEPAFQKVRFVYGTSLPKEVCNHKKELCSSRKPNSFLVYNLRNLSSFRVHKVSTFARVRKQIFFAFHGMRNFLLITEQSCLEVFFKELFHRTRKQSLYYILLVLDKGTNTEALSELEAAVNQLSDSTAGLKNRKIAAVQKPRSLEVDLKLPAILVVHSASKKVKIEPLKTSNTEEIISVVKRAEQGFLWKSFDTAKLHFDRNEEICTPNLFLSEKYPILIEKALQNFDYREGLADFPENSHALRIEISLRVFSFEYSAYLKRLRENLLAVFRKLYGFLSVRVKVTAEANLSKVSLASGTEKLELDIFEESFVNKVTLLLERLASTSSIALVVDSKEFEKTDEGLFLFCNNPNKDFKRKAALFQRFVANQILFKLVKNNKSGLFVAIKRKGTVKTVLESKRNFFPYKRLRNVLDQELTGFSPRLLNLLCFSSQQTKFFNLWFARTNFNEFVFTTIQPSQNHYELIGSTRLLVLLEKNGDFLNSFGVRSSSSKSIAFFVSSKTGKLAITSECSEPTSYENWLSMLDKTQDGLVDEL